MKKLNIYLILLMVTILFSCNSEKKKWEEAKKANNEQSYSAFLKEFPEGDFMDSANFMIQKFDFESALTKNTIEAFEEFNKEYSITKYKDTIDLLINKLLPEKPEIIKCEIISLAKENCEIKFDLEIRHKIDNSSLSQVQYVSVLLIGDGHFFAGKAKIQNITTKNSYTNVINCTSFQGGASCPGLLDMSIRIQAKDFEAKIDQSVNFK